MSCHKFEGVISDVARQQIMETGIRDEALAHCAQCPACNKKLEEQRALTGALRALAQTMESVEAAQRVPELLTLALRNRPAVLRPPVRDHHFRYSLPAVAAALLVFFAIGAVLLRQQPKAETSNPTPIAQTDEQTTPQVKTTTPAPAPDKEKPQRRRKDRSNSETKPIRPNDREAVTLNTTSNSTTADYNNEIATEFLPLGYGNALNLQEGGQIVRVEMPRSTLVSFGLPVNMNRASERVKADLLVGVDGSARAIRFVQ